MNGKLNDTCYRRNFYIINNETYFQLSSAYEGIPLNLAINVGLYFTMIVLFLFLRKRAWNYGKLDRITTPLDLSPATMYSESNQCIGDTYSVSERECLFGNKSLTFKEKILKIIPLFVKISDEQLSQRCGQDAMIYCQFQRYLMIIVVVMTCFSLMLILPLNFYEGLLRNSKEFSTLTIRNINHSNPCLWAHFSVVLFVMLFAFFISERFIRTVDAKSTMELSSTIMVKNIPVQRCDELSIEKHFQESFPSAKVCRVQAAYRVDRLISIYSKKVFAENALQCCYSEASTGSEPIMVSPYGCGRCTCSRCCQEVDGVKYYSAEVERLTELFINEKSNVLTDHKLPIVFVTFENRQQALSVKRYYVFQNSICIRNPARGSSSLNNELESSNWDVTFAPPPHDILWNNLHKHGWRWWIPAILANMLLLSIVLMLSLPSVIFNLINHFKKYQPFISTKNPVMSELVPSLLIAVFNSLIPAIVCWSSQISGHWTKTYMHISIMNKVFLMLLVTSLILPSLGLISGPLFIKWLFQSPSGNGIFTNKLKWECIFMPDGGALFCNYLISATFLGTGLDLLQLGDLIVYSFSMCCAKSRAEDQSIIQKFRSEFQYGFGYATTLTMFSMVSAYAVIVPIITPFGFIYFILKYYVDRYNIIHVNVPSSIHHTVHTNASQLMQIGLVLSQITLTIFITLRRGYRDALSITCYVTLVLAVILSCGRTVLRWIMSMACVKYYIISTHRNDANQNEMTVEDECLILINDFKNHLYLPKELFSKKLDKIGRVPQSLKG